MEAPGDLVPDHWRERALNQTGSVPPEIATDLGDYLVRPEDLRPGGVLPSIPTQMLSPSNEPPS